MKKNTKLNPSYIVDVDQIEYLEDIDTAFALGKYNAGLVLTKDELMAIVDYAIENSRVKITIMMSSHPFVSCCPKKTPWYKRFWNWICRK